MAHFAEIKESNNEVVRVLVFSNEDVNAHGGDLSTEAEEWVKNTTPKSVDEPVYWKQTSYNKNFRKNYAGREFTYDSAGDVFITELPTKGVFYMTSWDEDNQKWTAYDFWDNNINYEWNPSTQSWETI
jgi:hypothetical protein